MKFICPKCGVRDEVIGDDAPLCLRCRVPLIKATENYTDLMMSPSFAIRRFETVMGTHGFAAAKRGRHKREREAWITAVWALGLREITGNEYWVEIETRESTPDTKVHFLDQSAGYNHRKTHNIEVVEWDEHRDDVMELIAKKCARAYPCYFFLVVFARNGKHIDVADVSSRLNEISVPFGEIWILGRLSAVSTTYGLFWLYPSQRLVEFDLVESLRKDTRKTHILKPQGRSKSTEMEDLGTAYLPIA